MRNNTCSGRKHTSYNYPVPPQELNSTLTFWRIVDPASDNPILGRPSLLSNFLQMHNTVDWYKARHIKATYLVWPHFYNVLKTQMVEFLRRMHKCQLYVCHPVAVDNTGTSVLDGDRIAIRWYQLNVTGDPTGKGQE